MQWEKFKTRYPYQEIWWMDAAALDGGWLSIEEFQRLKKGPEVVLTRGWIIDETETDIYYCCDVGPKGETNGRGQIPKNMILERRDLAFKTKVRRPTSPATTKSTKPSE